MKLKLDFIPNEIIQQYRIKDLTIDGWIYIKTRKGMYGLIHAGKVSNKPLQEHFAEFDQTQAPMKFPYKCSISKDILII